MTQRALTNVAAENDRRQSGLTRMRRLLQKKGRGYKKKEKKRKKLSQKNRNKHIKNKSYMNFSAAEFLTRNSHYVYTMSDLT